jgi:hypothetical protein
MPDFAAGYEEDPAANTEKRLSQVWRTASFFLVYSASGTDRVTIY